MVEEKREKRGVGVTVQTAEERKEGRGGRGIDFRDLAKSYRDSYLEGLEVALKNQEQMERLIRDASRQGFAMGKEWLKLFRQWVQAWPEITGRDSGIPNPWLTWSKESTETACGAADLLLRATEDLFDTGFTLYEKTVAESVRRYTRQLNKPGMDAMIQG